MNHSDGKAGVGNEEGDEVARLRSLSSRNDPARRCGVGTEAGGEETGSDDSGAHGLRIGGGAIARSDVLLRSCESRCRLRGFGREAKSDVNRTVILMCR